MTTISLFLSPSSTIDLRQQVMFPELMGGVDALPLDVYTILLEQISTGQSQQQEGQPDMLQAAPALAIGQLPLPCFLSA